MATSIHLDADVAPSCIQFISIFRVKSVFGKGKKLVKIVFVINMTDDMH